MNESAEAHAQSQIRRGERLADALKAFLLKIDNITSDEFAQGTEKTEREAAREALREWKAEQDKESPADTDALEALDQLEQAQ